MGKIKKWDVKEIFGNFAEDYGDSMLATGLYQHTIFVKVSKS